MLLDIKNKSTIAMQELLSSRKTVAAGHWRNAAGSVGDVTIREAKNQQGAVLEFFSVSNSTTRKSTCIIDVSPDGILYDETREICIVAALRSPQHGMLPCQPVCITYDAANQTFKCEGRPIRGGDTIVANDIYMCSFEHPFYYSPKIAGLEPLQSCFTWISPTMIASLQKWVVGIMWNSTPYINMPATPLTLQRMCGTLSLTSEKHISSLDLHGYLARHNIVTFGAQWQINHWKSARLVMDSEGKFHFVLNSTSGVTVIGKRIIFVINDGVHRTVTFELH